MEVSLTNYVESATVTPSTEATDWDGDNVKHAHRQFLPWRTTVTTSSNIVIDFGAARRVSLFLIVNCNFRSATIQGHTSDSWSSPSFSQAITIGQNPFTGRYQHGVLLTTFNYRYMRVLIGAQGTTDGAAYFSVGGIWAGPIAGVPRPFKHEVQMDVVEPRIDVGPSHRGWSQRLELGDPVVMTTMRAWSKTNEDAPAFNDQLEDWLTLERQIRSAVYFVLVPVMREEPSLMDATQIYVSKRENITSWRVVQLGLSESVWTLLESAGP